MRKPKNGDAPPNKPATTAPNSDIGNTTTKNHPYCVKPRRRDGYVVGDGALDVPRRIGIRRWDDAGDGVVGCFIKMNIWCIRRPFPRFAENGMRRGTSRARVAGGDLCRRQKHRPSREARPPSPTKVTLSSDGYVRRRTKRTADNGLRRGTPRAASPTGYCIPHPHPIRISGIQRQKTSRIPSNRGDETGES